MKRIATFFLVVSLFSLTGSRDGNSADPAVLPVGKFIFFKNATLCDDHVTLERLIHAQKQGSDMGRAVWLRLVHTPSVKYNGTVCARTDVEVEVVSRIAVHRDIIWPDGSRLDGYVLHVVIRGGNNYFLLSPVDAIYIGI